MFQCSCDNCKFNIANFYNKINYCNCECFVIFPCYNDSRYRFDFNDSERFKMAQEIILNVNISEKMYYYVSRDPENTYNVMYTVAINGKFILKGFCPESGRFFYHRNCIDVTDNSDVDGAPKDYKRFSVPYYVISSRNMGYKLGQYIYISSLKSDNKDFVKFSRISDFNLEDLWIYQFPIHDEACEGRYCGRATYTLRLCNHRKRTFHLRRVINNKSTSIWWMASYNHRKKSWILTSDQNNDGQ